MNFFKLISQSKLALSRESELELDYVCGSKIKDMDLITFQKPEYKGIFLQIILFFYKVLRNIRLLNKKSLKKRILIFSETINQFNSLKTTSNALKAKHEEYCFLVSKKLYKQNSDLDNIKMIYFNLNVVFTCFILFFLRSFPLYLKLKKKNQTNKISFRFNQFCMSYIYVPYFIDLLKKIDPKIVIISNDHSVSNRSLRLSAEILRIKTIYVQHASVSELFPPLEFNYTFLDGKIAHQIYLNCYKNQTENNLRIKQNIKNCEIILSGQKKLVIKKKINQEFEKLNIGLAVNELDNFNHVREILGHIKNIESKCIIRTHPAQDQVFIRKLSKYIENKDWLIWSDARVQMISDYFANINIMIASNSSIHLEAAIAGLPTFYYEMSENLVKTDYYGYVKNGISIELKKKFSLKMLQSLIKNTLNSKQREQAIKNYSQTYNTFWQNREGQLTAIVIDKILNNKPLNEFFDIEQQLIYKKVWSLKNIVSLATKEHGEVLE